MPRPMPPTGVMLSTHTLAREMVTRDKNAIFEDRWLDLLERFVVDPKRKEGMMEEHGWVDKSGARPGAKASSEGNLVGVCVARHGTEEYVFTDSDLEMLREWYASGKKVMEVKL